MLQQRALRILVAGALLAGCTPDMTEPDPSFSPADGARVATNASSYTLTASELAWTGEITFGFTNGSDRTISLVNCQGGYGLRLEKKEGSAWVYAWAPLLLACLSPPIEIRPGDTRHDTLRIYAARPGSNVYRPFDVDEIAGTYRLVIVSAVWDYNESGLPFGESLPLEDRVSNSFEIRTR